MPFSVLMSLYAKERPDNLRFSLDSIFRQSLPPDEVILVKDGPLTKYLEDIVNAFASAHPEMKIVALSENRGLGRALNEGLQHCSHELVARMDTDDIAKPERFARQVRYMECNPDIAVCGTWMDEFDGTPDNILSVKKTPETHTDITEYARGRNPLNHPSVMFRKSAVLASGNYEHFPLFEDYYLWARMIVKGYKLHNIQESLMWFRSSPDMYRRRGGWKYACDEARFQRALNRIGLISTPTACKNIVIRFGVRIMPNFIRGMIYKKLLRN